MGFSKLNLNKDIQKALELAKYSTPTEIQIRSIPRVLEGADIRASAQTGTGKTAAFLLPALDKLAENPNRGGKGAKILILTPTRELAQQITTQAEKYSKFMNKVRSVCVVGGVPYHKQQAKLSRPYDILVATPGRLMDYMNRGKISFSNLEMVILDEADRMLDMGFAESVEEILSKAPKERQTLLFSATLKGDVLRLSNKFMNNPEEIIIHSTTEKHENIQQHLLFTDNLSHKNDLLDHILNLEDLKSAIIFTSTKRHCDELLEELEDKGFACDTLHGDIPQRGRNRVIKQLKEGRINILIATDVAARGIDINDITHVINFDLPRDTEDYVHRIGRTGRAGKKGTAYSFAGNKDLAIVPRIEAYTGQKIEVIEIEGLEPQTKPKYPKKGGGRGDGPKRRGGFRKSSGGKRRSDPRDFKGKSSRSDRDERRSGDRRERSGDRRDRDERGGRSGGGRDRNERGGRKSFSSRGRDDSRASHRKGPASRGRKTSKSSPSKRGSR